MLETPIPAISVVIPIRNASTVLPFQLEGLARQVGGYDFEVILADNQSSDGLDSLVDEWRARYSLDIRVVRASKRPGVSHARNVGLNASRSDMVLICDADDVAHPEWVREMVATLQHCDVAGGGLETFSLNPGPERDWRTPPPPGQLPIALKFLPYAQGCNLGVWRRVALDIGGWDEDLVDGGDDVDFSWRAQLAGYDVQPASRALVSYRYRPEMWQTARQGYRYAANNHRLFAKFEADGLRPPSTLKLIAILASDVTSAPRHLSTASARGAWLYGTAIHLGNIRAALLRRRAKSQRARIQRGHVD